MADETRGAPNLSTILAIWNRRKWFAIVSFLTVFSAGTTITFTLPEIYQSAATVLVVGQQVPVDFVRPTVTGSVDARLQAINQEIVSRSRLESLINGFNLYPHLKTTVPTEALVERMRRDIEVKPTGVDRGGATVAFSIKYQGRNPETVARVTNTLASYYIEENMKVRERQATGTAEFLHVQLTQVKSRLEEQERRVSEFKRKNLGELPSQLEPNLQTLERLNARFKLNGEKQIRAREQRQELARLIDSMSALSTLAPVNAGTRKRSGGPTGPSTDAASAQLARMTQELADLQTKFSNRYPDVIQKKAEIAGLERQAAEAKREAARVETESKVDSAAAPAETPNVQDPMAIQLEQTLGQLNVELKALKEEENDLRASMATYQARVDNTPRRDFEFQELSRDYDSTRDLYRTLLKRYEEAQLSESLEQRQKGEQFRILEAAVPGLTPVAPNRGRLLVLSLALAVGVAAGLIVLAEQLDNSFHTVDELRAASTVPVIVSIPRIVTAADTRRRLWRIRLATVATVCGLAVIIGASYFLALGNEQLLRIISPGRF